MPVVTGRTQRTSEDITSKDVCVFLMAAIRWLSNGQKRCILVGTPRKFSWQMIPKMRAVDGAKLKTRKSSLEDYFCVRIQIVVSDNLPDKNRFYIGSDFFFFFFLENPS